jgi:amidase
MEVSSCRSTIASRPDRPVIEPDDASALADQIRTGKTTAREAVERALERAQNHAELGAVRFMDAALALRQADAIDVGLLRRRHQFFRLPFVGVPFLMKDLGAEAEGLPLTCGSALLAGAVRAIGDSDLGRRFRGAGTQSFWGDHIARIWPLSRKRAACRTARPQPTGS